MEIDALDVGSIVRLQDWLVHESRQGWRGMGIVDPGPGEAISLLEAFERSVAFGLRPEAPVAVGLWAKADADTEDENEDGELFNVRTWPSVITEVGTPVEVSPGRPGVVVMYCDPMTYLLDTPIWAAWKECSPGTLLGAALSLATGGDGSPTLEPALPGLPAVHITESLRPTALDIPYAIASGEPLGHWLASLFGRLGIRAELIGRRSGRVDIFLRDAPPTGTPVQMKLLAGRPTAVNAVIESVQQSGPNTERAALFDGANSGTWARVGSSTPGVHDVLAGAGIDLDDASYLAEFEGERTDLDLSTLRVTTGQPGLHPGRLVEFTNRSVSGAFRWQVARVWHGSADGRYRNSVDLQKSGLSWRPRTPDYRAAVKVTGVVGDPESHDAGELVPRDDRGHIPVLLGFSAFVGPAADAADDADAAPMPAPVSISLPVAEPMAGGMHGFVPGHRQGDTCHINLYHPMSAEVVGFVYAFDGRVGKGMVDVSAAWVADNIQEDWTGVMFRPWKDIAEEEQAANAQWRADDPGEGDDAEGQDDAEGDGEELDTSGGAEAAEGRQLMDDMDREYGGQGGG